MPASSGFISSTTYISTLSQLAISAVDLSLGMAIHLIQAQVVVLQTSRPQDVVVGIRQEDHESDLRRVWWTVSEQTFEFLELGPEVGYSLHIGFLDLRGVFNSF